MIGSGAKVERTLCGEVVETIDYWEGPAVIISTAASDLTRLLETRVMMS
jgi:hypothetical protein